MRARCASLIGVTVILLGGCYYEVRDGRTGQMYYSDQWVAADGYRGPLTFEDYTGVKRRIEFADVQRIGKRDYLDATTPAEEAAQPSIEP